MNVRCAVAAILLALGASACSASRPAAEPTASPAATKVKEICKSDDDCAPHFACTSDNHCRCQIDDDCTSAQACRAGLCLPR